MSKANRHGILLPISVTEAGQKDVGSGERGGRKLRCLASALGHGAGLCPPAPLIHVSGATFQGEGYVCVVCEEAPLIGYAISVM